MPFLVDTGTSVQGSDGGVIAALEVHELLRFMTLWNSGGLFKSTPRWFHDVCASKFPFL